MSWTLRFASGVDQDMRRLDRTDARFIIDSLQRFVANYAALEPGFMKSGKIKRLKGELAGFHRLRLRTYRVIYKKYEKTLVIFVVRVSHRREAYRAYSSSLIFTSRASRCLSVPLLLSSPCG